MYNNMYNITNHTSDKWGEKQLRAAQAFGDVVDIKFPNVDPHASSEDVQALATALADQIEDGATAMVAGEFTLVYKLTSLLKAKGVRVLAACSERNVVESQAPDGTTVKTAVFDFVQFREV